jgi:hypothetical protein
MAVVLRADYVATKVVVPVGRNDSPASMIPCAAANSRYFKRRAELTIASPQWHFRFED